MYRPRINLGGEGRPVTGPILQPERQLSDFYLLHEILGRLIWPLAVSLHKHGHREHFGASAFLEYAFLLAAKGEASAAEALPGFHRHLEGNCPSCGPSVASMRDWILEQLRRME